ncbi:DUF2500 domain-containing protein [Brevibacillus dissolubilis]|uniref:DUF2500 domain-containing protein n=1 Tax=Brevibacillus dissolubilis TaxID=1844116 RepID=UPI001115E435|nr:DUF2500 domain-containing protein [Brevibacillus dissolubilis]
MVELGTQPGFFGGAPVGFQVVFILVTAGILFTVVMAVVKGISNAAAPLLTVEVKVVAKRYKVKGHMHTQDNVPMHSSTTYYFVTFEKENGERIELQVKDREFGLIVEGDVGTLSYQGDWFRGFLRRQR